MLEHEKLIVVKQVNYIQIVQKVTIKYRESDLN